MALTDLAVRSAKAKDKNYKMTDGRGLYLFVTSKGNKSWRFDYLFKEKRKTLSVGLYPDTTLAMARKKVDDARRMLASFPPIDPCAEFKLSKLMNPNDEENTFESVARAWWESYMVGKAESHKTKVLRRFELYLFPYIGKRNIAEITAPELLKVIFKIVNQNIIETADRTLGAAGQVFRYAVQHGKAEQDITAALKGALPTTKVKNMAAFDDPKDLGQYLRAVDGFKGTFTVLCALKLAPMFFCRPGELRHARWSELNFESKEWVFDASKKGQKKHIAPLSNQAVEILSDLHKLSGQREYVFVGGRDPKRPMSESAVNSAIRRLGYDTQTEITGHGFRATARTILHERLGIDPNVIEHQLAHNVPDILGSAYNRTRFLQQRREMMQIWADYLDEIKKQF